MALEAFHNLKERKKRNVLGAISSCLKKMSYDELSVNDIVVEADISRGSFYNYFTDKRDAVRCLIESRVKNYFDMWFEVIKESDNKLFDGTKKLYDNIVNILSDEINITAMKNLKFFAEFVIETVRSHRFKEYFDNIIQWFMNNTIEGKEFLNTEKKMSNVIDMIIILVLNTILAETNEKLKPFSENIDLEYKLSVIEKGIKE